MKIKIDKLLHALDYIHGSIKSEHGLSNEFIIRTLISNKVIPGIISISLSDKTLTIDYRYVDNMLDYQELFDSIDFRSIFTAEITSLNSVSVHPQEPIVLNNSIVLIDKDIARLITFLNGHKFITHSSCQDVKSRGDKSIYIYFVLHKQLDDLFSGIETIMNQQGGCMAVYFSPKDINKVFINLKAIKKKKIEERNKNEINN